VNRVNFNTDPAFLGQHADPDWDTEIWWLKIVKFLQKKFFFKSKIVIQYYVRYIFFCCRQSARDTRWQWGLRPSGSRSCSCFSPPLSPTPSPRYSTRKSYHRNDKKHRTRILQKNRPNFDVVGPNQRVLNGFRRTRIFRRRLIWLLPQLPLPSSSTADTQGYWVRETRDRGVGEEPNHKAWSSKNHSLLSCPHPPNEALIKVHTFPLSSSHVFLSSRKRLGGRWRWRPSGDSSNSITNYLKPRVTGYFLHILYWYLGGGRILSLSNWRILCTHHSQISSNNCGVFREETP